VDASSHDLDISVVSSECHNLAQLRAIDTQFLARVRRREFSVVYLRLHHDATTIKVMFGAMGPLVAPHARYFLLDANGEWEALDCDSFMARCRSKHLPSAGSLNLFASRGHLCSVANNGDVFSQGILGKPCFLQSGNASTIYEALRTVLPVVAIEQLREFSEKTPMVFLAEIPDGCGPNNLKRTKSDDDVRGLKNVFSLPLPSCCCHTLHNVFVAACGEKALIGDVHAVHYVSTLVPQRARMLAALDRLLDDPEKFIFDTDTLPDPRWKSHLTAILEHTIGRFVLFVRGSIPIDEPANGKAIGEDTIKDRMDKVICSVTGDPRRRVFVHHEKVWEVQNARGCEGPGAGLA